MRRLSLGRTVLALGLAHAWLSLARVLEVAGVPHPRGLTAVVDLSPLVHPVAFLLATLAFVGALGAFVLRRRDDVAAAGMLVALALWAHLQASQWPGDTGVNGATTLPGAALLAWLVARRFGASGVEAACGIVAAAYPLAALSKLTSSGLLWASSGNIALHVASQSYVGAPALQPLRLAVARSATLAGALGVGTLVIELGAVAFLWRPARPYVAAAVVAMHGGIALLMGLHHYDWMFVVLGLALWSAEERAAEAAAAEAAATPRRP